MSMFPDEIVSSAFKPSLASLTSASIERLSSSRVDGSSSTTRMRTGPGRSVILILPGKPALPIAPESSLARTGPHARDC